MERFGSTAWVRLAEKRVSISIASMEITMPFFIFLVSSTLYSLGVNETYELYVDMK